MLLRRNKVAKVASETWPGNKIPTFKNNNKNIQKLNEVALELEKECLPYLNRVGIKQHCLDCLNERRSVKKGHDYESVCVYKSIAIYIKL